MEAVIDKRHYGASRPVLIERVRQMCRSWTVDPV